MSQNIVNLLFLLFVLLTSVVVAIFNWFTFVPKDWDQKDSGESFMGDLKSALLIAFPVVNWAVALITVWYRWLRDPLKAVVEG